MFRHPKKSNVRNPFLRPFTENVWWLSLNICIACWILLLTTVKIENYYNSRGYKLHSDPSSETALITFAAITQQGSF